MTVEISRNFGGNLPRKRNYFHNMELVLTKTKRPKLYPYNLKNISLFYLISFCLCVCPLPVSSLTPYSPTSSDFTCDLTPLAYGKTRAFPQRTGDNGFSVKLEGQPEHYEPEKTYTVTLRSTHPVTFRGFTLTAHHADNSSVPAGSFKIINPWATKRMETCGHVVTHATSGKKISAQFIWTSPRTNFGCVQIKASVIQKGSIWYRNDGDLSLVICEASGTSITVDIPECCACGTAKYRMTFYGLWSPETHPKNYPEYSTHWSNVIGASHSKNYSAWDYGQYASDGVKKVAEWGWPNALGDEIRGQGESVLSVIKTRAQWPAYQPRNIREPPSSVFDVDSSRHLVSMLTMMGPSPDWNVGITKESMCTEECGWEGEKVFDLTPWDAGTDSGVSYMSPNSPTNPPDKIRALTSSDDPQSPFYDPEGGPITPVARVVLSRLGISGEQCGPSPNAVHSPEPAEEMQSSATRDAASPGKCMYSDWTDWSQCEVTCGWGIKVRRKMLKAQLDTSVPCESSIMEKEICRGSGRCQKEDESTVCLYSDWTKWSACTAPCGSDALRFRTRVLRWPSESSSCHEPLKDLKFDCNTEPCDSSTSRGDCSYGKWSDWMPCSEQCGVGQTLRKRFALVGGEFCESPVMETSKCMASVDCNPPVGFDVPPECTYSPWTGWMPCPVTCGVGQTFRKRVLASSTPNIHCEEIQLENTKCMTSEECLDIDPRDVTVDDSCAYSEWSDWMPCSSSCGVGETLRKRFLKTSSSGTSCDDLKMETIECYMPPCRVMVSAGDLLSGNGKGSCIYGPWTEWVPCSVTCGRGETLRKRFLKKSLDISRTCEGFDMETNQCTVPVDCDVIVEVTEVSVVVEHHIKWSDWTTCSATCGYGVKHRRARRKECPESETEELSSDCFHEETEECDAQAKCPVDCILGEWGEWSPCPACRSKISRRHSDTRTFRSTGFSQQTRTRQRLQKPRFGGRSCENRRERRKCVCK